MKNFFLKGRFLTAILLTMLPLPFLVYANDSDLLKGGYRKAANLSSESLTSSLDSLSLPLPVSIQEQTQWCWAGSSQSVLEYYGTTVSQCQIANYAWSLTSCCANPGDTTTCNKPNSMYGTSGSLQDILLHSGVSSTSLASPLSEDVVRSEVISGRPFIMRWGWTGGGGHFLVGYGADYCGYVSYMDPGSGYNTDTYTSIVSDSTHDWTHSLRITEKAPSVYAFSGSFSVDNEVQKFNFTVDTQTIVTLKTSSYAGGPSTSGTSVASGGFDPILAVFDSTGQLIATNDDGSSCSVATDSVTNQYYDTFLSVTLTPGTYTVAVSQYDNFANGPNLSDGFYYDGASNTNFTQMFSNGNAGYFYDDTGTKRDGHWAFDIYSAAKVTMVNESTIIPVFFLLLH